MIAVRRRIAQYRDDARGRQRATLVACVSALLLGVLAGLSVAMPVGPVGVLLLRTGLVDGVRVAVAAACGIATVDLAYAVVAVAVGAPVSRVLGEHAALVPGRPGRWCSLLVGIGGLVAVAPGRTPTAGGGSRRPPASSPWVPTCASSGSPRSTR